MLHQLARKTDVSLQYLGVQHKVDSGSFPRFSLARVLVSSAILNVCKASVDAGFNAVVKICKNLGRGSAQYSVGLS